MRQQTIAALEQLNRTFHAAHVDSFDAPRSREWPGWRTLCEQMRRRYADARSIRVLDAGCGNGRLLGPLRATGFRASYCGVDRSAELLARARGRHADPRASFVCADLSALPFPSEPARFDWVAALAALHHVPSFERRRALVAARHPGELLEKDLEPGDVLLRFGPERRALRYCHWSDQAEIQALLRDLPGAIDRFAADGRNGRLNRYVVIPSAAADPVSCAAPASFIPHASSSPDGQQSCSS